MADAIEPTRAGEVAEARGPWPRWEVVASLFALAIVIRLCLLAAMGRIDGDAVIWVFPPAEAIASGEWGDGFLPGVPPLYPVLVAGGAAIFGDVEIGARAVSLLAGVLVGLPLLLLLRRAHGARVGLAGLYLIGIQALFCRYSVIARGEVPAAVFFVVSAHLGWRLIEWPGAGRAIALGVVSGLGFLVRPECLALPVVVALWLLLSERSGPWKSRLLFTLLSVAPLAAILGAHSLWIHTRTGAWTLTPKLGINLEYGEGPSDRPPWWALTEDGRDVSLMRQVDQGDYSTSGVVGRALKDPLGTAGRTLRNGARFLSYLPDLIGYANLLLLPFCIAAFRDRERRRHLLFVLSVMAFAVAALSLFHPARRMIVILIPLGVVFPAIGLSAISDGLLRRSRWGLRWVVILWVALLMLTVPFLARTAYKYGGWWSDLRVAGSGVRGMIYGAERSARPEGPARIMAHPSDLATFSGGEAIFFPRGSYEATVLYAKEEGAEFILYEEEAAKVQRPEFEAAAKEDPFLEPWGTIGPVLLFRLK